MAPAEKIKEVLRLFDPADEEPQIEHANAKEYVGMPLVIADEGEPNESYTGRRTQDEVSDDPMRYSKEERRAVKEEFYLGYICHVNSRVVNVYYCGQKKSGFTSFPLAKWRRHVALGNVYSLEYLWEECPRNP